MPPSFIHLRVHSAYSLLEGAIKIKDAVKLAKKYAMPALAVTDTDNMFGTMEFALEAAEQGVQPIIGCTLRLRDKSIRGHEKLAEKPEGGRLLFLVQNETGYRNLSQLVSKAYLETSATEPPHITLDQLQQHQAGLLVLTGSIHDPIGMLVADGQTEAAEALLQTLEHCFKGRLYLELQRHDEAAPNPWSIKQQRIEPTLLAFADRYNLPLVATNAVYFAVESMFEAHDALLCIAAKGHVVADRDRPQVTRQHYFKSPEAMAALFTDVPEAIENTVNIAKRCAYWPQKVKPMLPPFKTESGLDEVGELKAQAEEGLAARLAKAPRAIASQHALYQSRLQFELDVITAMGFAGYFLIVADFIKWAKAQDIPVGPGRGSGVGSLVAYALTITDLDPLPFNLLFERFLNPERVSMPDFDIDFCQERRDEVIAYVQQRYGADRVAQIITFGKLQARAVLRNVGRVLAMPLGFVDKICKLVPMNPANPLTLDQAVAGEPQLQALQQSDASVAKLIDIARKLEGLTAHASTHAAGLVIGGAPLQSVVPLYRDPGAALPVTQFNMKTVEQAGLVKFDFLGLKTLDVLHLAVKMVQQQGETVDLATLPFDDAKTYALLARGDTLGVFQLEGAGMRDALRRMKPNRFEDIIALVALYRPGPMDNIPKYIKVKAGEEQPDYLHPLLEPVLKETYGIAIYQEQVMQIAQILAGYTLGGADLLRRAMGKKIKEEMAAQRQNFVTGAQKNGVEPEQASRIFDQVDKFAGYGFNKSHAAAYALIAYQTAYIKANYPQAFYAASMTFEMAVTEKLNIFRQELVRVGIPLLPPDINRSGAAFLLEGTAIRYALAAVKGVGAQAMQALVAEREANGTFKDGFDFASRLDSRVVNKRQMESLIRAGGFDSLNKNRAQMLASVELLTKWCSHASQARQSGQESLFGGSTPAAPPPQLPEAAAWDELTMLQEEFDALGFYLSAHPLDAVAPLLERLGAIKSTALSQAAGGKGNTRRRIAGMVISKQERTAKSGNRFAFLQCSDASGLFEVMLFAEVLSQTRDLLTPGTPLLLTVDVQGTAAEYRLTLQQVEKLEAVAARESLGVLIQITRASACAGLETWLEGRSKGKSRIHLLVDLDGEAEAELTLPHTITLPTHYRRELKEIEGVVEVQDL